MSRQPVAELYRQKYGSRLNQCDLIRAPLYDTLTYTSGATVQLVFFEAVRANKLLSNMVQNGSLPYPEVFHLYAIRIVPKVPPAIAEAAPTAANDVYLLMYSAYCELKIGHKDFGIWPAFALPGGAGVAASSAGAGGEAGNEFLVTAQHGAPDPRAVYAIDPPIQLDPNINFSFTMYWPAAVTLSGNKEITVLFDGHLIRPVQ